MSNAVHAKFTPNKGAINLINEKAVRGLFMMGFDIANQARRNAPWQTGALRNTIRVKDMNDGTVEVIAGGSYGGKKVPYALRREYENNLHPEHRLYMTRAKDLIMSGDYIKKYFGEITK